MSSLAFLSMGLSEMIVVAVVALLIFGGRLPEVMHSLGKTYAKFRRGMSELSNPIRQELRRIDASATARARTSEAVPPVRDEPPRYEVPSPEAEDAEHPLGTESRVPSPSPSRESRPTPSGGGAADEPPPV